MSDITGAVIVGVMIGAVLVILIETVAILWSGDSYR